MLAHLRRSVTLSLVLIVLCLAYTGIETGIAQAFFKSNADGSLVTLNGKVIGSSEIAQSWSGPKWFQGRDDSPNPASSGPTNYGPRSINLYDQVKARVAALEKEGCPPPPSKVRYPQCGITPTNGLVTGSGSGLDPDIAYVDALAQVNAVAKANGLPVSEVHQLVVENEAPAYLGVFGAPYINVLQLNLALYNLEQHSK
jgi:potassium-transporting ATPase KdpC subunit